MRNEGDFKHFFFLGRKNPHNNNLRPPRLWASLTKTLVPLLLRPHTQYSYSYYLNYLTTNDTDNTHHHQKEREEEPPSAERALNREDRARSETSDSSRANREILKKGDDFDERDNERFLLINI